MRRLILYLVLALLAAAALAWWVDNPGAVTITWFSWQIDTSFAVLVFLIAFALALGLVIQWLYLWARREMPVIGENRHLRRQQRGLKILNRAIISLAAGDGREARKLALKAQKLLPPQPMMQVVAAQAAKLSGDTEAAKKEFKALMESPEAAFLGVRGLLVNAVAEGRTREARRLAEKAKDINPKSAWAIKTLFDLEVKATDWDQARATLDAGKKAKVFSPEEAKSLLATLYYCQAKEAELANDKKEARRLLSLSFRSSKDLLPAALMASRLDREAGKTRAAARVLENAWAVTPHPDLAEAYALLDAMETPAAAYARFKKLCKNNPYVTDSLLLLAEKAIEAENLEEAEKHLQRALEQTGRARAFALKARLEREKGATEKQVLKGEQKAEAGAPEPLWECANCGAETETWSLHCTTCRMFNTLLWRDSETAAKSFEADEARDFLVMLPDPLAGGKDRGGRQKKSAA